jgi:hypothetical protein
MDGDQNFQAEIFERKFSTVDVSEQSFLTKEAT